MRGAGDKKSSFVEYMTDVQVWIGEVIVQQLFFILKKGLNDCILKQSFKIIVWMTHWTLNDKTIQVTIFDSKNDEI